MILVAAITLSNGPQQMTKSRRTSTLVASGITLSSHGGYHGRCSGLSPCHHTGGHRHPGNRDSRVETTWKTKTNRKDSSPGQHRSTCGPDAQTSPDCGSIVEKTVTISHALAPVTSARTQLLPSCYSITDEKFTCHRIAGASSSTWAEIARAAPRVDGRRAP